MTASSLREVHVVLPNDIDDPATPSGGNRYDREVCTGLAALGWTVHEHPAAGTWPTPSPADLTTLDATLTARPTGALVLVDGLVAGAAPGVMTFHAARLRLVVLVHMPFGDTDPSARPAEHRALRAATRIITVSDWTRDRIAELYALPTDRIDVATPGVAPAPVANGSVTGRSLLCVAVVGRHKGQDVLVEALAEAAELPWTCTLAGALDRYPEFVTTLRARIDTLGLGERIRLAGARTGAELDALYDGADLLVHPSRGETYGMVAAEALARGIPVLATTAKGLPDAVGRVPDEAAHGGAAHGGAAHGGAAHGGAAHDEAAHGGAVPGLLVPPDDPAALATALRRWLEEPDLRRRLRVTAAARRTTLTGWDVTVGKIADALRRTVGEHHGTTGASF